MIDLSSNRTHSCCLLLFYLQNLTPPQNDSNLFGSTRMSVAYGKTFQSFRVAHFITPNIAHAMIYEIENSHWHQDEYFFYGKFINLFIHFSSLYMMYI